MVTATPEPSGTPNNGVETLTRSIDSLNANRYEWNMTEQIRWNEHRDKRWERKREREISPAIRLDLSGLNGHSQGHLLITVASSLKAGVAPPGKRFAGLTYLSGFVLRQSQLWVPSQFIMSYAGTTYPYLRAYWLLIYLRPFSLAWIALFIIWTMSMLPLQITFKQER